MAFDNDVTTLLTFLLCAIAFPALGFFIKHSFTQAKSIEDLRFQAVQDAITLIRANIIVLENNIDTKASIDWTGRIERRVCNHEHKIVCAGDDCSINQTAGVLIGSTIRGE